MIPFIFKAFFCRKKFRKIKERGKSGCLFQFFPCFPFGICREAKVSCTVINFNMTPYPNNSVFHSVCSSQFLFGTLPFSNPSFSSSNLIIQSQDRLQNDIARIHDANYHKYFIQMFHARTPFCLNAFLNSAFLWLSVYTATCPKKRTVLQNASSRKRILRLKVSERHPAKRKAEQQKQA